MKTVRTSQLIYSQGTSDKAYEVDLCDVSSNGKADQFVVNFRYGRRGSALREGTKTPSPVARDEADKIFDSLVVSKLNKGYQDANTAGSPQQSQASSGFELQNASSPDNTRYQGAVSRVKAGLADIASKQLNDEQAGRIVWRAGELGEAQFCAPMLRLLDGSNDPLEYSLIWALGRCGDENTSAVLLRLITSASSDKTRRLATWASIRLLGDRQSKTLLDSLADELPKQLSTVVESTDRVQLQQTLNNYFNAGNQDSNDALHLLYLLSFDKPRLRSSLLKVMEQLVPQPNIFRGIRQVYKAAEFFKDAEVFGILNLRFDVNRSYYTSPNYGDYAYLPSIGSSVKVSKETAKPNSRIAYSSKTRLYLRRRTWRCLKRMGELGQDDYVEMAMGVLLSTRPEHKQEPKQTVTYSWGSENRYSDYDEYAHLYALVNIAFGSGERYKLAGGHQTWQVNPAYTDANVREELFPELWNKHPGALLQLLLESGLHPVHEFAAKALIEQTGFFDQISIEQLHTLLTKQFPKTKELAFAIAKSRYDAKQPDFRLVYLLLDSEYPPAVAQAREWVSEQPKTYAASVDFLFWVVTARSQDTRQWCRTLVELAENHTSKQLLDKLLAWLLDLDAADIDQAQVNDVEWVLLNPQKELSSELPFEDILKLLEHQEPAVQVVAGRLLLNHKRPAEDIPPAVFTRLLESPVAEVRGVGVELFGQLPTNAIVRQPELVESFCVADEAQVRAGIRPAIDRVAKEQQKEQQKDHQDFCRTLMRSLVERLFRKESAEGVHDDLVSLLTTELAEVTATCSKELNWRLLRARSLSAQSLGVWLLGQRTQTDFSVRQWAVIAHGDNLVCREWAWQCYRDNPEKVVEQASDALRIIDGNWEDSRLFAFDYFRTQFPDDAWQPALLISICDSVRGDVQTFGRELLSRFFKEEDGEEYLLKLSQHPSSNVQLFASNYLERFATGSIDRMNQLEQYFVTVLSGVNKNRVSKNRVTTFLLDEATRSESVAILVARIFSRQSVTMAITDKAKYLIGMRDLTLQYPQLDMPMTIQTRKVHPALANDVHGYDDARVSPE